MGKWQTSRGQKKFNAGRPSVARPKEDEALREEELNRFKRKVGELTIDLNILRTAGRLRPMTPCNASFRPRLAAIALAFSLALHLHQLGRRTFTSKLLNMPSTQLSLAAVG
ncbi:MAG TPA: hypothetical protein VMF50_06760 [Candidatus Binataceae bacterium]|nr:hypothetical protein [Candidatus Binataceae bacterium]